MFEFSDKLRTLTVYNYSSVTGEYISTTVEQIAAHTGLPADSTITKPRFRKGRYPVYNKQKQVWTLPVDHVGKLVYDINTGIRHIVDRVGRIPNRFTFKEPIPYSIWNGKDWVYQEDVHQKEIIAENKYKKSVFLAEIEKRMEIYADMVELDVISEEEKEEFKSLKLARIMLHRIDLNSIENTWPELRG